MMAVRSLVPVWLRSVRAPARRRIAIGGAALAVLLLLGSMVLLGQPQSSPRILLTSGSVWVDSPQLGYVTLIDGPSEQVVATVVAGAKGSGRRVAQLGTSAVLTSDSPGELALIDGATFDITTSTSLARPGSKLSVLTAGSSAYLVDASSGTATVLDTDHGLTSGRTLSLDARPGPSQATVDATGRLWVVDATGRGLTWVDPDGSAGKADADGAARLVAVGSATALAELTTDRPEIGWLAADGELDPWSCDPPTRPADTVQVLGDRSGSQVFVAVDRTGTLTTVTVAETGCRSAVQVADTGHRLGPLVQSGAFVFVPDLTTGHTIVVDTARSRVVADVPLTDPGHELELLTKDGIVFYNDLDSERAGVIRLDESGQWVAGPSLRKYNPVTNQPENPVRTDGADVATTPSTSNAGPVPAPTTTTLESASPTPSPRPTESTPSTIAPTPTPKSTTAPSSTTRTTVVESTRAEPSPTPLVVDITATPNPLVPGQDVTFQATVNDASGAWRWSAAVFDTDIGHRESAGAFTVNVPVQAESVAVTLQVGTSEPFTRTFPVVRPSLDTTATITGSAGGHRVLDDGHAQRDGRRRERRSGVGADRNRLIAGHIVIRPAGDRWHARPRLGRRPGHVQRHRRADLRQPGVRGLVRGRLVAQRVEQRRVRPRLPGTGVPGLGYLLWEFRSSGRGRRRSRQRGEQRAVVRLARAPARHRWRRFHLPHAAWAEPMGIRLFRTAMGRPGSLGVHDHRSRRDDESGPNL